MSCINPLDNSLLKMLFGIKTENKSQTVSTTSIPEPDYSSFDCLTKTDPAMSEEEYKKAIVEQAKEDAAKGICSGESTGYQSLMKSYVSVVSPDRKGIIAEAPKSLKLNGKASFLEIKDSSNNVIAQYSQDKGWTMISTKAEAARGREFCYIYMEAWRDAYLGKDDSGDNSPDGTAISGSTFDVSG